MPTFNKPAFTPLALGWTAGVCALVAMTFVAVAAPPQAKTVKAASRLRFNQDVLPVLSENCYACHGPDSAGRKAGLRLDKRADAVLRRNGGLAAIAPGDPAKSEMIRRMNDRAAPMPPADSHKSLTQAQIALLTRWVKEGAVYEPHWSYIPPTLPRLPKVQNTAWVRNPIDAFILARLEKANLTPAPEADKRTLARRVCLDLTGLPPDPTEVERFVADKSPNAYEKLVDKYMASAQWGEHRARYWLDAARYADTHGIHFDNYREMWSYRDWVIGALNRNQRFDQFSIEQLAGDLLPKPTLDQKIATGFNRCNITTNEGGAIPEEYAVLYTRDRTDAASQVWMGATAACAVCHDHKFDPLSQREFYSLSAFFNNTTQNPMDGNVKDTAPVIVVPKPQDRTRWDALAGERKTTGEQMNARKVAARPDFDRWSQTDTARTGIAVTLPVDGLRFHAPLTDAPEATAFAATVDGAPGNLTATGVKAANNVPGYVGERAWRRTMGAVLVAPSGVGDWDKGQSFSYAAWLKLPKGFSGGSIFARMDDQHDFRGWDLWIENNKVAAHFIHKWPEDAIKVQSQAALTSDAWHHVCVTYNGGGDKSAVSVYVDGALQMIDAPQNALKNTIRTTVPLKIGQRDTTPGLEGAMLQDVRLYDRVLTAEEVRLFAQNARAAYLVGRGGATPRTSEEQDELLRWWLDRNDAPYRALQASRMALDREDAEIRQRGTVAHVAQEKAEPAVAYVLNRGEYSERREKVTAGTPRFLPPMPKDAPRDRLGFARWLFQPNHPLTARVTVNRMWQEVFGQGLVRTTGDFGISGEMPSHPELLDWLAVDFRDHGWDVKRYFKQIVMSATYRQAALATAEKKQTDPQNRLLARGPRFRMDAEMIRDYALASSGLLAQKVGGPSVRPYQADGVWEAVAMPESDTRNYKRDTGDALYRRSMYTFWKRAALAPTMDTFNAPAREACTVRRERTNTPIQALVTLNDVQFVEAARALAVSALKNASTKTAAGRADYMAWRLLARPFRPKERTIVLQSVADLDKYYRAHPDDARKLLAVGDLKPDAGFKPETQAAWTMLANQLMNLDEVVTK